MTVTDLPDAWRSRAKELEPFAPSAAQAFAKAAEELEVTIATAAAELLTMREAVAYCGYTGDHLTALVRRGILRNHGRKHAPRFKRDELPMKPGRPTTLSLHRPSRDLLGATPRQAAAAIARR